MPLKECPKCGCDSFIIGSKRFKFKNSTLDIKIKPSRNRFRIHCANLDLPCRQDYWLKLPEKITKCPKCKCEYAITSEEGKILIYLPNSKITNWSKTTKWKIECDDCKYKMWYFPLTGKITRRNK